MKLIFALIAGMIFGLGLVLSGMSNPFKVLNFLDIFGSFDPSLIFVMLGAITVTYVGYRLVYKRDRPLFGEEFTRPADNGIDGWLAAGAICFGVGWGLVGFCPGPALTSLTFGGLSAMLFVIAMLVGFVFARLIKLVRDGS